GYNGWETSPIYSLETGIGLCLLDHSRYTMDMELVAQVVSDFKEVNYNTTSVRILNGFQIWPQLKFFVAPTLNFTTAEVDEAVKFQRMELRKIVNDQRIWLLDVGGVGGLQYVF